MKTYINTIALISTLAVAFSLALFVNTIATANTLPKVSTPQLPMYSKIYDATRDPFKDAADALALAKETKRQVLIEIGGNWCSWCEKMDTFLINNPDVYGALHNQYVLLKINVSDTNENDAFMKSLPPVLGYPHMYVSTAQGKMLLSKDTAELLVDNNYSRVQWLTFLDNWSAKTTLAQALLSKTSTMK